jgi:two-component system chemotaxis response regulator CheB
MGSDGTQGLGILKQKGAYVIGQDEASCVVYGMPKAPAELGYVDVVTPLQRIAAEIVASVK